MNRREFLDLMRYYLRSYPVNIVNDIVSDYEEHFRMGLEHGKSEAEIAAELGSPKDIADEFLLNEMPPRNFQGQVNYGGQPPKPVKKDNSAFLTVLMIILLIFAAPPLFGVALSVIVSFVAIIVALLITVLALGVSGVMALFSWVYPFKQVIRVFEFSLHPVTSFFLGIFLIGLSILIGYLTMLFFSVCIKAIKNLYLSIKWNLAKRRRK